MSHVWQCAWGVRPGPSSGQPKLHTPHVPAALDLRELHLESRATELESDTFVLCCVRSVSGVCLWLVCVADAGRTRHSSLGAAVWAGATLVDARVLLVVVAMLCCAALRPFLMVYNHSAMYCLKSLAHMQGSALCLFVCV